MTESGLVTSLHGPEGRETAPVVDGRRGFLHFDSRGVLRGLYLGRLAFAAAMFLAVVVGGWHSAAPGPSIVSLSLVAALAFTAASFIWTDLRQREAGSSFRYLQVMFDMLLVTAAVHVTWTGGQSQLAPLYILVIAVSALLVAPPGVPLLASFGMVMYFADAMLAHGTDRGVA